jgi:16S rRNA (guanine966-N2)-methyltransferase
MKDRTREAVFNLIGPSVRGKQVLDLFAGTGVLALEALSRGASRAALIEQHFPTAAVIRSNVATLGLESRCEVVSGSVFAWWKRRPALAGEPWLVFCSPPYAFYVERKDEMLQLLGELIAAAPAASAVVVEADDRFNFSELPAPDQWDVRHYPPAMVGIRFLPDRPEP